MKLLIAVTVSAILIVIGQRFWSGHPDDQFRQAIDEIVVRDAANTSDTRAP